MTQCVYALQARLIEVLRGAAAANPSGFSSIVGQLNVEEMVLVEKAVHA